MRLVRLSSLAIVLSAAQLWADVSFVMKIRFEPDTIASSMPKMPIVQTHVKGTRSATETGGLRVIMDLAGQEVTLIDPENKTFAAGPLADYLGAAGTKIPKMPAEVEQLMSNMETTSRKTDRTEIIEGIKAGEREIQVSIKVPVPAMPSADGARQGPQTIEMRLTLHLWTALPAEIDRFPALRELDALHTSAGGNTNGEGFLQMMRQMLPGGGESMSKLFDEISKEHAYPLRTQMELTMSGMAEMWAKVDPKGVPPEFTSGPLMKMTMELAELSTATIDEAVFRAPKDFKPAPFADLVKKLAK